MRIVFCLFGFSSVAVSLLICCILHFGAKISNLHAHVAFGFWFHACSSAYILHVQKVHVVHCIHPEYHIEPTALHKRTGIVFLL